MWRNYSLYFFLLMCLLQSTASLPAAAAERPADYVNPFIGTANSLRPSVWESNGGTYPGAALPFGMVQASPDGYRYADNRIRWFSFLNHTSGYPNGSSGNFYLMPYVGKFDEKQHGTSSAFSHDNEVARPGYYTVLLRDFGVTTEFSLTPHAAICRFDYPKNKRPQMLFGDFTTIETNGTSGIQGKSGDWYLYAELSKNILRGSLMADVYSIEFPTGVDQPLMLKIGFSHSSIEAAKENLLSEIPAWDFDAVREQANAAWNKQLGQIRISGGTETDKRIFYSALYHSFLDPHLESDVHQPPRYSQLSPWDTFRSKQPLVSLLLPDLQADMIQSVLDAYRKTGHLPAGPMTGNHNIAVIVDSYMKGIRDFDIDLAYEAMKKAVTDSPFVRPDIGKYSQWGYVPAEQSYSVTKTLEYAYDDWALAQMAGELGFAKDRKELLQRSLYYHHLFNPATKFMQAKTANGRWAQEGFREGDRWTYNWFVPHDVRGLINLMGGDDLFIKKLEVCFRDGHYVHDNEPPLHYAYLFNYAGAPWRTQKWVEQVRRSNYSAEPGGLPGNDDLGALSAWFVFSALGLYPVCPGRPAYDFGLPLFEEIDIRLANGRLFKIKAPCLSAANRSVSSVKLNGVEMDRCWVSHREIENGGELLFEMGSAPNKSAFPNYRAAASLTTGRPDFQVQKLSLSKSRVAANELFTMRTVVCNHGAAAGTCDLDIFIDDIKIKTESAIIDSSATTEMKSMLRLYEPGQHWVRVNGDFRQKVTVTAIEPTFVFKDLKLPSPPMVRAGEVVVVKAAVQNIGSYAANFLVGLSINGQKDYSRQICLQAGEKKGLTFEKVFAKEGIANIGLADLPPQRLKIYRPGSNPDTIYRAGKYHPLLLLPFDGDSVTRRKDLAGVGNRIKIINNVEWVTSLYGHAVRTNSLQEAYIEVSESSQLLNLSKSKTLTMMAWIYPVDEKNFADFLTRGDLNVLQVRASNTAVNFYSGGYQRGEAYARAPANWNRNWHHVAGVTEGNFQKLYIDGRLLAQKKIELVGPDGDPPPIGTVEVPWCIGRNAQHPQRNFNGYIDDVRVYSKALPQSEIFNIILNNAGEQSSGTGSAVVGN